MDEPITRERKTGKIDTNPPAESDQSRWAVSNVAAEPQMTADFAPGSITEGMPAVRVAEWESLAGQKVPQIPGYENWRFWVVAAWAWCTRPGNSA
jgi:hypothetical protein